MESTGKSITQNGKKIKYQTGQIIVGDVGSNAQHAINQLFHQGTRKVSCDFIATINRSSECEGKHNESLYQQHLLSLANCFAQSKAFMEGTSTIDAECEESNYKYHPGDHPSTTILLKKLSPYSLGQLIALYEHKVFVMASIWRINPFDQPASELGRNLAKQALNNLEDDKNSEDSDISTNGLIGWIKEFGE